MTQGILGPIPAQVTLGAGGIGFVRFAPAGETWDISNISVRVSTHVLEATATVYKGLIGDVYRLSGTFSGSSGDNNQLDVPIHLNDGDALYIQWVGGDVGAVATATVSGVKSVVDRGFRTGV